METLTIRIPEALRLRLIKKVKERIALGNVCTQAMVVREALVLYLAEEQPKRRK